MNIYTMRYLKKIQEARSISRAAQENFISQSCLSRTLHEVETEIGFSIFQRTNKGVVPTYEGQEFLNRIGALVTEIDQIEELYYRNNPKVEMELMVAIQRNSLAIQAFIDFYNSQCRNLKYVNLALQETTTEQIIKLVSNKIYQMGILHYTSDNEEPFLQMCEAMQLDYNLLNASPVCVQVHKNHPLAKQGTVSLKTLSQYPHITFSDEDITKLNYCSDILQFNQSVNQKRIVVQGMASMQQIRSHTDGYFIGCNFSKLQLKQNEDVAYVPITDVDLQIKTAWVVHRDHYITQAEDAFIHLLEDAYQLD